MRGHGEGEAHAHPAAVAFHRRVYEICDFGKGHDIVELFGDFARGHAEDRAVEEDVVAPGEFIVKAGAHFEQRCDATAQFHRAPRGGCDGTEDFQQSGFACAIVPDDRDDLSLFDVEIDVAQCPEISRRIIRLRDAQQLVFPVVQKRAPPQLAEAVELAEGFDFNGETHWEMTDDG